MKNGWKNCGAPWTYEVNRGTDMFTGRQEVRCFRRYPVQQPMDPVEICHDAMCIGKRNDQRRIMEDKRLLYSSQVFLVISG